MKKIIIILFLTIAFCNSEKTYSQCSIGYWYGFTSYSVTDQTITVNWSTDTSGLGYADSYEVWLRLNDYTYGISAWSNVSGTVTGGSYTITGLNLSTTYEITIKRYCNGTYRDESSPQFSIQTAASPTFTLQGPVSVTATNITTSQATIGFSYYPINLPSIAINDFKVYYKPSSSTTWILGPQLPAAPTASPILSGLAAGTKYDVQIVEDYTMYYPTFSIPYTLGSTLISFTTLVAPGACGSVAGNYTAPVISNNGATDFYSGSITSALAVTQSTLTHTFEGTAVVLNPGFVTAITGTGSFISKAFNPANCATTKFSGPTKTATLSGSGLESLIIAKGVQPTIAANDYIGIHVYPNPTTGILNIHPDSSGEIIKQVLIINEVGQTVLSADGNNESVNISSLANGLYIYKVETNQGSYTGKVNKK